MQLPPILFAAVLQFAGVAAAPPATAPEDLHSELVRRYLAALAAERVADRCASVDVRVRAALPKLNRQAELRAVRITSPGGEISYRVRDAEGDSLVRREVIGPYLAAESQAQSLDQIAITPAHYRFRFLRVLEEAGRLVQVFQLSPRQKRVGLFKGELWLDGETGLPVRESGQFVKSPSVFVKRVVFVRDYLFREGFAIPHRISAAVETRVAGRAELSVEFGDPAGSAESACE